MKVVDQIPLTSATALACLLLKVSRRLPRPAVCLQIGDPMAPSREARETRVYTLN